MNRILPAAILSVLIGASALAQGPPAVAETAPKPADQLEVTRSRPLCVYPLVAKSTGTGSTDAAASFVCSAAF